MMESFTLYFWRSLKRDGILEMNLKGLRKMNDVLIRDKGELRDFVLGMSLMGEGFSKNRFTLKILRRLLASSEFETLESGKIIF